MTKIQRFEDIEAWKIARELAGDTYRLTSTGKFARDFPLRDQVRRASVSILSNIAEGFERSGNKEFIQFLALAKGSAGELRAQMYVALDQQYVNNEEFGTIIKKATDVSRMLSGLMRYLQSSTMHGTKYK
ncbi:MAG: four helix bundle protein [Acidobacteriia bacterium]|nr:four helix bundle protein [Terriglobia bacterium]